MNEVKGKVLKHDQQTRTMHWIHLLAFIILAVTGIGFYFHLDFINNLFGGGANASAVHRWTAVIFTVVPLIYIMLNFERFSRFVDTISTFTRDDINWLKVSGGYVPFLKGEVPPQDKYNAGQKVLGGLIIAGCLLVIITGFPMWLFRHDVSPWFLNLCYTVHFWTAAVMIVLIAGHFFLAAIHPKSRVEFASMMIDGYVDAEVTAHHNAKWFAELEQVE